MAIKTIIEVIGEGQTYNDLFMFMNKPRLSQEMASPESFGFYVYTHQRVIPEKEKVEIMNNFPAPWVGTVDLKNAQRWFYVMEDWRWDSGDGLEKSLLWVYFGKQILDPSFHPKDNLWTTQYELKDRIYLGPTSTTSD